MWISFIVGYLFHPKHFLGALKAYLYAPSFATPHPPTQEKLQDFIPKVKHRYVFYYLSMGFILHVFLYMTVNAYASIFLIVSCGNTKVVLGQDELKKWCGLKYQPFMLW